MAYEIKNNFENLQEKFKKETGMKAQDEWDLYIKYYHARMADTTAQATLFILQEIASRR